MGDLGEEEVVGDVAVGDIVAEAVNAHAVGAVDRLQGALDIGPLVLLEDHGVLVVVLCVRTYVRT